MLTVGGGVQETPGLKGNAHDCANALCNYLHQEQQQYAEQELGIHIPRDNLLDGRVDVVLYFLPINARISEDDLDTIVMNAMSEYAPVIPIMARVRPPSAPAAPAHATRLCISSCSLAVLAMRGQGAPRAMPCVLRVAC